MMLEKCRGMDLQESSEVKNKYYIEKQNENDVRKMSWHFC